MRVNPSANSSPLISTVATAAAPAVGRSLRIVLLDVGLSHPAARSAQGRSAASPVKLPPMLAFGLRVFGRGNGVSSGRAWKKCGGNNLHLVVWSAWAPPGGILEHRVQPHLLSRRRGGCSATCCHLGPAAPIRLFTGRHQRVEPSKGTKVSWVSIPSTYSRKYR